VQVILDSDQINRLLEQMADAIAVAEGQQAAPSLVGVRSRGEILAMRLGKLLEKRVGGRVDRGALDITLYRDDLNQMRYDQPKVRATEIDFDIDGRLIVLVDDVLNTGRSVRAAMDALIDLGRPQAIRLAVLVDRGSRELPIRPDFVGESIQVPRDQTVQVYLSETDDRDEVVLQ